MRVTIDLYLDWIGHCPCNGVLSCDIFVLSDNVDYVTVVTSAL